MPDTPETIETLAHKPERQRFACEMKECRTREDFKALKKKYEVLAEDSKK